MRKRGPRHLRRTSRQDQSTLAQAGWGTLAVAAVRGAASGTARAVVEWLIGHMI